MKRIYLLLFITQTALLLHAQNIGIGTKTPLSKLHVAGDLRIDSLAGKDSGTVIYTREGVLKTLRFTGKRTDILRGDGTFEDIDATLATSTNWLTTGNTGTDTAVNFLGTTDNKPLRFRVNNIRAGEINPMTKNISFGFNSLSRGSYLGYGSVAIGSGALQHHSWPVNMIAIGDSALFNQEQSVEPGGGTPNQPYAAIAIGYRALYNNFFGNFNTAIGDDALYANWDGYYNVAMGKDALSSVSSGSYNSAVGAESLSNLTDGESNSAFGAFSMRQFKSGSFNTAIGAGALQEGKGNNNTAIGYWALRFNQGSDNVAVGVGAMSDCTTGKKNVGIGTGALGRNTTGFGNIVIGYFSGGANQQGNDNTAVGNNSLIASTVSNLTAIGSGSLSSNTTGIDNTATGRNTLNLNVVGINNTANGSYALRLNTESNNTGIGAYSLYFNQTGNSNSGSGTGTLYYNTTGSNNTASGRRAIYQNTSGSNNTASGYRSLYINVSGSNNTAVGALADVTSPGLSNATALGYNAKVNASNKVRIGNSAVTKIEGQVPFSTPSDGRYKFNVREDVRGLDFIMRLRPVTYQFDVNRFAGENAGVKLASYNPAMEMRRTGFIAQEVEAAATYINYDFSGIGKPASAEDHYSLSYEAFVVPLVKAVQEQQATILKMQQQIDELLLEIKTMRPQISK